MKYLIDDSTEGNRQFNKTILIKVYLLVYCAYFSFSALAYYFSAGFKVCIFLSIALPVVIAFFQKDNTVADVVQLVASFLLCTMIYYAYRQGYETYSSHMIATAQFFLPLTVVPTVMALKPNEKKNILVFIICCLTLSSITTIIGNNIYPLASRNMASSAGKISKYMQYNIGGYGFVYSLVCFAPLMVYYIKTAKTKMIRLLLLADLGIFLFCIIQTSYSTALILYVISIPLAITASSKRSGAFFVILIFGVVFLAMKDTIGQWLINRVSASLMEISSDLGVRAREVGLFLLSGDASGDMGSRLAKYTTSLNSFLGDPLLGALITKSPVGGHSEILDVMGGTGIIGTIIYVSVIWKARSEVRRNEGKGFHSTSMIMFFILVFMIALHTVFNSAPEMAYYVFITPLLVSEDTGDTVNDETAGDKTDAPVSKYIRQPSGRRDRKEQPPAGSGFIRDE